MNFARQYYNISSNNNKKKNNLDQFINKSKINIIKKNYDNNNFGSSINHYNNKKPIINDNKINYDSKRFISNLKVNKIISNKIELKNNRNNNKSSLFHLNKFINQKNLKALNTISYKKNFLLKAPIERGMYSYKKSNNFVNINNDKFNNNIFNINQKILPIKKNTFTEEFLNSYKSRNNKNNEGYKDYKNFNNLDNFQFENISNIKQKINSSMHHINSSSSINTIENVYNNNEFINNNNNLRNLILKNKIYNQNNKYNFGEEEQENKNINVNKSTKSTKSRSLDLNRYLIKPFNDNIKINYKKSSMSSFLNKKSNQNEIGSFDDPFSNQESIQLYKFKSNEFDDFVNYNAKNLDNEKNLNNNYMNDNNKNNDEKNKYNKENRRLIIEYLKILRNKNKSYSIEELCKSNNIEKNLLNVKKNQKISNKLKLKYFEDKLLESNDIINNRSNKNYEKIDYLNFLSTPRIMFLINDLNERIPYIFYLSPSPSCHNNGVERYSFKWSNINNLSDKNSYDLFHLKKCNVNKKDFNKFDITFEEHDHIEEGENFTNTFIVDTLSFELARNYVKGLNYFSSKKIIDS